MSLFVDGVLKQTIAYRRTTPFAGFYNGLAVGAQNVIGRKPLDGVIDELASLSLLLCLLFFFCSPFF